MSNYTYFPGTSNQKDPSRSVKFPGEFYLKLDLYIQIIRVYGKDSEAFLCDLRQNLLSPTKHSVSESKVTNLSNQPELYHKKTISICNKNADSGCSGILQCVKTLKVRYLELIPPIFFPKITKV